MSITCDGTKSDQNKQLFVSMTQDIEVMSDQPHCYNGETKERTYFYTPYRQHKLAGSGVNPLTSIHRRHTLQCTWSLSDSMIWRTHSPYHAATDNIGSPL